MERILDVVIDFIKGMITTIISYMMTLLLPIQDYFKVIIILATLNIVMGLIADSGLWNFKKAYKAFWYLLGYLLLLLVSALVCKLMHVPDTAFSDFSSWITWVMIYFYVTNILRNWNIRQPDNRVISFLYWVFSFKVVDKIQYLKEFLNQDKALKHDNK